MIGTGGLVVADSAGGVNLLPVIVQIAGETVRPAAAGAGVPGTPALSKRRQIPVDDCRDVKNHPPLRPWPYGVSLLLPERRDICPKRQAKAATGGPAMISTHFFSVLRPFRPQMKPLLRMGDEKMESHPQIQASLRMADFLGIPPTRFFR